LRCKIFATLANYRENKNNKFFEGGNICSKPVCGPGTSLVETEVETLDGCPYYKCVADRLDSTTTCQVN
jgi:hypothetical protein